MNVHYVMYCKTPGLDFTFSQAPTNVIAAAGNGK